MNLILDFAFSALTCLQCDWLNADGECVKGESTCEAKDDQECGILVVSKGASSLGDIGVTLFAAQEGTIPLYTPGDKAETRVVCFLCKFRRLLSIWYWLPTILCQKKTFF